MLVSDPRGTAVIHRPLHRLHRSGPLRRNEAEVFKSRPVADGASEILGGDPDADEIQSVISANGEFESTSSPSEPRSRPGRAPSTSSTP